VLINRNKIVTIEKANKRYDLNLKSLRITKALRTRNSARTHVIPNSKLLMRERAAVTPSTTNPVSGNPYLMHTIRITAQSTGKRLRTGRADKRPAIEPVR
jgi:hypothetical protein